jgi:CubicO group peptidase (beta-lactamase class C family)
MTVLVSCNNLDAINFESNTKADIDEFIDKKIGQVVSISIVDEDDIYQYHFGKLNNGSTPNNHTVYELASITKTYTGLVVAKAILDRKIELNTDIRHYLKNNEYENLELSNEYITFRHLITHTSGLPKDFAYSEEDAAKGIIVEKLSKYSREKYFEDLKIVKLNYVPGSQYQYSNAGTKLVAYILESVYKKPFELLISEIITTNSGEKSTEFRGINYEQDEITIGINKYGERMPLLSPYSWAEGGLTSTVESVTSYIQYQLSSSAEVTLSHKILDGDVNGHGRAFFWNTYNYDSSEQMLYHSGGSLGTSSWLALYPKKKMGIFIITNISTKNAQEELNVLSNRIVDNLIAYNKQINQD